MSEKNLAKDDIIKLLKENKNILKKFTVKRAGLFGSFVKGNQKKDSDIDLIVEFEIPSLDNYLDLIDYLENLFGRKVKVLTPDGVRTIRIKEVAEDIKRNVLYV